ncbi:MAG: Eco57I restriction-modification methylase domain-containing protein [Candidatus Glassbacteria bacterium]|nr:Eco57I restriction-modification methylase domain-containing protein [Candidatus Glassbacteria bacterium]
MKQEADILLRVEKARKLLNGNTSRKKRSEIGQFLTPAPIASFMASLYGRTCDNVRVLDAGAGAGALLAALVRELSLRAERPKSIMVTAYENDTKLLPYLEKTMVLCRNTCSETNIVFDGVVLCEDFISNAVADLDNGLFSRSGNRFTHAILNPPYKKINGESSVRKRLNAAGLETSNLYAAFVWLASQLLLPGGEIVAITPRSFCNGPYFRRFRKSFLNLINLRRIHLFESRKEAFADDSVLQENIIFHGIRGQRQPKLVTISVSKGPDFANATQREIPFEKVVLPGDRDAFIHLIDDDEGKQIMERMSRFKTPLIKLGLEVSTGRVVDFRSRKYLRQNQERGTVPLVYPCHFDKGFVRWPQPNTKKPNAIVCSDQTQDLLVKSGHYVLTKRFSAKEERRRVVSVVYDPDQIKAELVGFENHLNYFHARGKGMPSDLAKGLSAFLNSTLFDRYFRLFSGHTQVNSTDLRKVSYPPSEQLYRIGKRIGESIPDQETIDDILEQECGEDG